MTTKLLSLKFTPKANGWESEELVFGDSVTFLKGDNGSGKTPLILGIVFCLGYPSEFRNDILKNCFSINLMVNISGKKFLISRTLDKKNWVSTDISLEETQTFKNEKEFATWFMAENSIPLQVLTSSDEKNSAEVYMSTYMPSFYIDQNHGWQSFYYPPKKFIKDQYQEMLRLLLGVSPKNPHKMKNALIEERMNFSRLQELVDNREFVLKELERAIGIKDLPAKEDQIHKKEKLQERLRQLQQSSTTISRTTTPFQTKISDLQILRDQLDNKKNDLRIKVKGFESIKAEVGSEVEALTLNADAANMFKKFCGVENCKLFCASESDYGKSLLYLKDQVKDLEQNNSRVQDELLRVNSLIINLDKEIVLEKKNLEDFSNTTTSEPILREIEATSKELIEVETHLAFTIKMADQKSKYSELLIKRNESKKRIQELESSSRNTGDKKLADIRVELGRVFGRWIKILHTPNVKEPYIFDEKLNLTIGGEKTSVFSGSTLTRIVLSYHASIIEVALKNGSNHLGFCIMDTPMQQELKVQDLQDYIVGLRKLLKVNDNRIQLCLSFSDANIIPSNEDTVWLPIFKNDEDELKYLNTKVSNL